MLGLRRHDRPWSHPPIAPDDFAWCPPLWIDRHGRTIFAESIPAWRRYAHAARSVVPIGQAVRDGRPGSSDDWA